MFIFGIISLGDSIQGFFSGGCKGISPTLLPPQSLTLDFGLPPPVNLFNLFFPHGDTKLEKFLDPDSWIPGI